MNIENLQRMADHIETIPQSLFDMEFFRRDIKDVGHECNSVGCILGHCTVLDDPENIPRNSAGRILYQKWSYQFLDMELPPFGTVITGSIDEPVWQWLFGARWRYADNTPTGSAKRIRHFIEHGLPEDWYLQYRGGDKQYWRGNKLCYV